MVEFSHLDNSGKVNMVDIGDKKPQHRIARASGKIFLSPATIDIINNNKLQKGDLITTAKLAGIQAANNAGMTSIGIGDASILNEAHHVFKDFTEISNEFLHKLIAES